MRASYFPIFLPNSFHILFPLLQASFFFFFFFFICRITLFLPPPHPLCASLLLHLYILHFLERESFVLRDLEDYISRFNRKKEKAFALSGIGTFRCCAICTFQGFGAFAELNFLLNCHEIYEIRTCDKMGSHMSKSHGETSAANDINNLRFATELNSYEAACKSDADVQAFDAALQSRTNTAIRSLAAGVEVRALSFDSLREVTSCLLDMNQEVVKVILDCKKDIWKNQELFEFVEEYFENSLKILDFCTALEKCLKSARDRQLLIHIALQQFEEEAGLEENGGETERYTKTLLELKNFKDAGDPFTEEFFKIFESVYRQQMQMLERLQSRKNKLDKKLKSIHAWRKVSTVIFAATFAAVLICSVVAAAMAAPPVAAALAAASSIPLGSMGRWIDSLLKNYENAVRGQKEIINYMNVGTYIAIKDLDNIRVLVDRLEVEIESLLKMADFAIDEDAVKVSVEEIRKKLVVFTKNIEELEMQADNCSRDIRRARTVILQRIIKHPNN